METEVWPNVFHHARRGGTPLVIANARMSDQSLRAYRRWPALIRPALRGVSAVLAQSGADAARFEDSGADPAAVRVTGNLKFDLELPEDSAEKGAMLRAAWGTERPVVTAGSTHEADESALLAAFGRLLDAFPDALLVLAPRHPERFARAAQKVRDAGLHLQRLGTGNQVGRDIQCLLIDAMGELLPYYGAADVAFVGGSIARIGGHNVLEPAAFGKPVLFGPHTDGNREVCEQLVEAGGALRVRNAHDLAAAMERLLADAGEREQMGRAAARLVNNGRGALETSLRVIEELLAGTASEGTRAG